MTRQTKISSDTIGPIRFTVLLPAGGRIADGEAIPSMAISPDGRNLAMVLTQADDTQSIWLRPISSEVAHRLDGTDGASLPFWSPDGTEIGFFAENQLKRIAIAGGHARVLCRPITSPGGASWGRGGVIVYSAANVLHTVESSGGPCRQLTRLENPGEARHAWPQFLPDGRRFLYLAAASEAAKNITLLASLDNNKRQVVLANGSRVSVAPPDYLMFVREGTLFAQKWDFTANKAIGSAFSVTGADIPVASNVNPLYVGAAPFSASENGVLVYRTRPDRSTQIVSYSRDGKRLKTIGRPGNYSQFSLSPDEKTFALFVAMTPQMVWRIWLLRHDTEVISQLDFGHKVNGDPVWSPDSRRIVFASFDAEDQKSDLFEWTVGEHEPKLLFSDGRQNKPDDWSNDGRILVYRRDNKRVGALAMDVGKPLPTGDIEFRKDQSQLSPDGSLIAYNSDRAGGRQEIYVGLFPSFRGTIQVSSQGGVQPLWSSDGKELFYVALDKNLMSVQIRNGRTIEATAPKPLFRTSLLPASWGSYYAVSHDVQKIYILESVPSRQDTLHVFTHWNAAQ
jgi:Tol biopolymer transport system component